MNFSESFRLGRAKDKAVTRINWHSDELYVYHGMDNIVCLSREKNKDTPYHMCVADAIADDWKLVDVSYHGWRGERRQGEN